MQVESFLWTFLFWCSDLCFLSYFPVTWGSSGDVFRLVFIDGYERSTVVVVDWLEAAWSGRIVARKILAWLFFFSGQHFSLSFSDEVGCHKWWFSAGLCWGHSKIHSVGHGGHRRCCFNKGAPPLSSFLYASFSTFSSFLLSFSLYEPLLLQIPPAKFLIGRCRGALQSLEQWVGGSPKRFSSEGLLSFSLSTSSLLLSLLFYAWAFFWHTSPPFSSQLLNYL